MAVDFDSFTNFTAKHIDTWLITFSNFNKKNSQSVVKVHEETMEMEK